MLQQKILDDIKTAMKAGDQEALGVLRMAISGINNLKIEKKGSGRPEELTDEEVLAVLTKELKKRRDSIDLYTKGGRPELAAQEEKEATIIQKYLPAQMSREEIEKKVDEILRSAQNDKLDFGSAMKLVMAELKGKADAKLITELIKSKLN